MANTAFTAISEPECQRMLSAIGARSCDDLFSDIPPDFQTSEFDLPSGLSEMEVLDQLRRMAERNATHLINFCGGGFYDHFIPAAVDALASRAEFYTAYTPYQPEASQGTLQAIYEYQTDIVRLTEMEVANASLYDGGTALFEAIMMALRITGRNRILVDTCVNPIYRTMLRCYLHNLAVEYQEVVGPTGVADHAAFRRLLDGRVAGVVLQNPNFFGCVDDVSDVIAAAHEVGALGIVAVYPVALGILKTPGEMGADMAVGEGQSLGLPLSLGGPYLGFMATRKKYIRQMPGRIVGMTRDAQGRRGFVLTLQAREQHIRREKATSNICTNEALCALRAHIHLSLLGREGLVELAKLCAARAAYARARLESIPGVRLKFQQPFFNELVVELPRPAREVVSDLLERGFAPGFPLSRYYPEWPNALLVAVTEKRSQRDIDMLAAQMEDVL